MSCKRVVFLVVWLLAPWLVQASELADKLRASDHVLLIRHALAPGVSDPPHFSLSDCRTQRNLNEEGRQQAVALGQWLRQQGVDKAEVHTSAWCRCQDTASLLRLGEPKIEPALNSFFEEMHQSTARTQALQAFIAKTSKTKGDKALILVTHHVNIFAFMGENIGSGDMVLAKVNAQGQMVSYQRIPRPL